MVKHLGEIACSERIGISDAALQLVAQIAHGGLRDAETLLDQLSLLADDIGPQQVWDLVGTVPEAELLGLVEAIAAGEPPTILTWVRNLLEQGKEPLVVLQNLTEFYTKLLIAKTSANSQELLTVTEGIGDRLKEVADPLEVSTILSGQQHLRSCEMQVKLSRQPQLWLEVALLGLLPANRENSASATPGNLNRDASPSAGETIWQQVVNLQLPAVRLLLKQHAKLVSFQGNSARIKVSSSPLKQRVEQALPGSIPFGKKEKTYSRVTLANNILN